MKIEKRNMNLFTTIIIVVLAAILLTAFGGYWMQNQNVHFKDGGMGFSRGASPMMAPESAQTGPTGKLVNTTGIILLVVGGGVLVLILLLLGLRNLPARHST